MFVHIFPDGGDGMREQRESIRPARNAQTLWQKRRRCVEMPK